MVETNTTMAPLQIQQYPEYHHEQLSGIDKLLDKVNGQGTFQSISFLIFGSMWFVTAWLLVGQSFFFDSQYKCVVAETYKECQKEVCSVESKFRSGFIRDHADSIVFTFQQYLICDCLYLVTVLQSMLFFGSLIGFFVLPYVADNFGRKIALRISWGICTLGVFVFCLATSPTMVGIGYFLAGLGCNPAITLCFSFINEVGIGKTLQLYAVGVQIFFALGQSTIGLMFITGLSWRQIAYVMFSLCLVINLLLVYLVETPKFLMKRSKKLALQSLNTIAERNGRQPLTEYDMQNVETGLQSSQDRGSSLKDLFRYKSLRWKTIASGLVFLAIQVIYYSTALNLDSVGNNKLMNQQIIGISEGLSLVAVEFVVSRVYRKKFTFIGMLVSSGMCLLTAILTIFQNDQNRQTMIIAETVVLLINRFVLCSSWAVFFVYIAELFPTRVRSLGFGWASAMGTIGGAASPYIRLFSDDIGLNPWIVPGLVGFVGAVSICFLPETLGQPLQDQIQEKYIEVIEEDAWSDTTSPTAEGDKSENTTQKNFYAGRRMIKSEDGLGDTSENHVALDLDQEENEDQMVQEFAKNSLSRPKEIDQLDQGQPID